MKISLVYASVAVLVLTLFANVVWAKAPVNVSAGVHNLSINTFDPTGAGREFMYASNIDEICVFCHTPHGGTLDGPLWNRNDATPASWSHYQTATLAALGVLSSRAPNNESMLCLSCHDGSVGVYRVINVPNNAPTNPIESWTGNPNVEIVGLDGLAGARIGGAPMIPGEGMATGNLTDDHPISFSYNVVWNAYDSAGRTDLRQASDAINSGVQFFGPNNNLECSSCHDPHADQSIPEYSSFLITSNSGSKLCLACHVK